MREATGGAIGLLQALRDRDHPAIKAGHVAIVFAHPDDETIGCGAQLQRLRNVTLVLLTDGAPRGGADARAAGFPNSEAYAEARRRELVAIMRRCGLFENALVCFQTPDQESAFHLPENSRRLASLMQRRGITAVITHCYEGGHPDHDAAAFVVHAAARLVRTHYGKHTSILEMPLYRVGEFGAVNQSFVPEPNFPETTLRLNAEERELKRRLVAHYATQARVLAGFQLNEEKFRVAPNYDFSALPNGGKLFYESYDWGLTGEQWLALARGATADLLPEQLRCG
jgi:N-acetylglucosamine malate deacetylase 2